MVFSSMLFVFLFLTANIISQLVLKTPKAKNIAMLVFSLVFYSWSGPRYTLLLLLMVLICWIGALAIDNSYNQSTRKLALGVTTGLCLLILCIFKYTGFLAGNLQHLFGFPEVIPSIVLPIGISFYTFQLISYVVDVYREEVRAQEKYWMLLLYASLFHQCIAGPIVRYQDIHNDIVARRATMAEISRGVSRFTIGLAKKAILANGCAVIADTYFELGAEELAAVPALGILLGAFAFFLQIYLDFSAYSDMAIGMGLMCGFHYKENFNYPYISRSISEYWSRWHISLGSFFRDYVYIPLGGSRCSVPRQILNLFIVWGLTGLWHGASWNYVLWGLYYGVLLGIGRYLIRGRLNRLPEVLKWLGVLILALIGTTIFKFTDMSMLAVALKGLLGLNHNGFTGMSVGLLFKNNVIFIIITTLACTPFWKNIRGMLRAAAKQGGVLFWVNGVFEALHPLFLLILSAMALAGDSYNPFLYFQF